MSPSVQGRSGESWKCSSPQVACPCQFQGLTCTLLCSTLPPEWSLSPCHLSPQLQPLLHTVVMVTSIFHLAFWVCWSFVCQAVVWWPQCSVPFPPWLSPLDNFLRDTLPSRGCSHRSFLITPKHCAFRYAGLLSPASLLSSSLSYMFLTIFIWPHFRSLSSEIHRMRPRMVHPSEYHHPRFICITLASPWCTPSLLPQTPLNCETVKSCLLLQFYFPSEFIPVISTL